MLASSTSSGGGFLERVLQLKDRFELTIKSHFECLEINRLQKSKNLSEENPVSVHLRIRPLSEREEEGVAFQTVFAGPTSTLLYYPSFQVLTDPGIDIHEFPFDGNHSVSTSQDEMYEKTCQRELHQALQDGSLLTIFAYGQTGSGKTYTISGISSRLLDELPYQECMITIQMIEVLGSNVRDLITGEFVQVLIDAKGKPCIMGNTAVQIVNSRDETGSALAKGLAARKTVGTLKNDTSSRSHFICVLRIINKAEKKTTEIKLVDLAGSERNNDTVNHDAERIKESTYINSSLMALKNCIRHRSTSTSKDDHIPIRSSKLTMLLKEALIPPATKKSKLVMIATVAPTLSDVNHSLDTFRYASALRIRRKSASAASSPSHNSTTTPMAWSVKKLEGWFASRSVALKDLVLNDLDKKGANEFVAPAWKFIYTLTQEEWTKRLGPQANSIRLQYRALFLKKRPSTKSTDVSGSSYEPETVLLMEMPRTATATVRGKSRAQIAMDKLREKGLKGREKASTTTSTLKRRL